MKLAALTDLKNKDKKWKFIVKKKKSEIIVVVGTKEFTPAQLIGMLLKHAISLARNALGNPMVTITIGFDKIDPDETLLFNLAEAAKLEEIVFDFA